MNNEKNQNLKEFAPPVSFLNLCSKEYLILFIDHISTYFGSPPPKQLTVRVKSSELW